MSRISLPAYLKFFVLLSIPVLLLVGSYIAFNQFIVHAIMTHLSLNLIIIGSIGVGMAVCNWNVFEIVREWRAFGRLARGPLSAIDLAKLKKTLSLHLIEDLDSLRGAQPNIVDQTRLQASMHELEGTLASKQEFGQYMVGFMVALGLLGTFIGLLETLTGIGELIGGMSQAVGGSGGGAGGGADLGALMTKLQKPIESMGVAFAASMFGLVGSLVLGFAGVVVRSAQRAFQDFAHGVMSQVLGQSTPLEATEVIDQEWLTAALGQILKGQKNLVRSLDQTRETLTELIATSNLKLSASIADTQRGLAQSIQEAQQAFAAAAVATEKRVAETEVRLALAADGMAKLGEGQAQLAEVSQTLSLVTRQQAESIHHLRGLPETVNGFSEALRALKDATEIMLRESRAGQERLSEQKQAGLRNILDLLRSFGLDPGASQKN